jgi:hypothetical protein
MILTRPFSLYGLLQDGSQAIEDLRERARQLEAKELLSCKIEKNCY